MKKIYFSTACLLAGFAAMFSSCSKVEVNAGSNEPVQSISLAVANTGDNFLETKANRPLYSAEAKQDINKVKVVIYRLGDVPEGVTSNADLTDEIMKDFTKYGEKTIAASKTFEDWMNGGVSATYNNATNGHGRRATWNLLGSSQIKEEGVYMAYAIGYNDNEFTGVSGFDSAEESFTFPLTAQPADRRKVREIFAGEAAFIITQKNNDVTDPNDEVAAFSFDVALTLHRQVAGAIGYFTHIPAKGKDEYADKEASKLRLVASGESTNIVFAGFNSDYIGGEGKPSANKVQYIVNGYNGETAPEFDARFFSEDNTVLDAYTVYEINLNEWFPEGDTNNDGKLNKEDTWQNKFQGDVYVGKGTVLSGEFMIPFAAVADKATFQLQLLSEDDTIINTWNIRLPQNNCGTVKLVGEDGSFLMDGENIVTIKDNVNNYSIVRNHLYSIGLRNGGDKPTTDPDNPEIPTDPEDKPQDLSDETLTLRVNDNWEMIHEMEID